MPGERRAFVDAQLALYEKWCGGWYWWTLKKEIGGDVGWSMQDAVAQGIFPASVGLTRKRRSDGGPLEMKRRIEALERARKAAYGVWTIRPAVDGCESDRLLLDAHVAHWTRVGGEYEHHRFTSGFNDGWKSNYSFFEFLNPHSPSVSEIGFKHAWAWKKGAAGGHTDSDFYWEYEHGFLQGAAAARADFKRNAC